MISSSIYFRLLNIHGDKVLSCKSKEEGKGFELVLESLSQSQLQLWMLRSADLQDVYSINNPTSGLSLQVSRDRIVQLHHFKNKENQKFKIISSLISANICIRQYSKNETLIVKEGKLGCQLVPSNQQHQWKLIKVGGESTIQGSSLLENQNSGYVLEVVDNAEKQMAPVIQKAWSGMFSQRWKFQPFKQFFLIRNLKSDKVLSVKGKVKECAEIVQEVELDSNYRQQLWSIEERGYCLYLVRLASEKDLVLGVQDFSKENSPALLIHSSYSRSMWRIRRK